MKLESFHGEVREHLDRCARLIAHGGEPAVRLYWVQLPEGVHTDFDRQWAAMDGQEYVPQGSNSQLKMVLDMCRGVNL